MIKMKKKYKIVKTELFKEQEKKLPKDVKREVERAIKNISKNPMNAPNSMGVFTPSSAEELKQWMDDIEPERIDEILEYLTDKNCLNKDGLRLAHEFWEKYIHEKSTKKS